MQIFKQLNKNLLLSLCTALLLSANPAHSETAETQHGNTEHAQISKVWSGIYKGFLPCADCIGIKTSLALNANNTYVLQTQNTGKSVRDFTEKGKFSWDESTNIIVLTSRDGATSHQYLAGDDILTQLDGSGNRVTSKDAERYILRRKDMVSSEPTTSHGSH